MAVQAHRWKYDPQDSEPQIRQKVLNFFTYLFSLVFFGVFILGSYDYLRNYEQNKCEMTYMFEYPQFVKIPLSPEIDQKFPMYGLYAYGEGRHTNRIRNFKFTGIPVLFIPGNAGSHKQARSFASVALRKWLDSGTPYHFDFFSIDFNEELSGAYGYVLNRQSEFTKHVVRRIRDFYEDYHHVVVIGHSMGGVIAKSINEDEISVQLIYSLATPHKTPVLSPDPEFDLFYYFVHKNWTKLENTDGGPVTVVSIAGGDRDLLIPTHLTQSEHNTVQITATSIPGLWGSTDHLAIVWCKQLVMSVVRSLFDMVEYKKQSKHYGITGDAPARKRVLEYHFVKRSSGKSIHSAHPEEHVRKPPSADWNENLSHSVCYNSTRALTYLMFPKITFEEKAKNKPGDSHKVLILTSNTRSKNWIFGCTAQSFENNVRYCSQMENLSNQSEIIPSYHRQKKAITLDLETVTKYSYIIVKLVDPINFKTCVVIDVYNVKDRTKIVGSKIKAVDSVFYNFTYPMTSNMSKLFAWKLDAYPIKVANDEQNACTGHHSSLGFFRHGGYQTNAFFKNSSLLIRFEDTSVKSAEAILYLDKNCQYAITTQISYISTAGQMFRTYVKILPSYITSITLMSLFFQGSKDWNNFHRVLLENASHFTLFPGFIVSVLLLLLPSDYRYMMTEFNYFPLMSIIFYMVAYCIILLIAMGVWFLAIGCGSAWHAVSMRFLSKKLGNVPDKVTDLALSLVIEKFPLTIAVLIVALSMSTCGTMGLVIGFGVFLVKIFKGYEDILEDIVRGRVKTVNEALSPINFQFHVAMIWLVTAALNLPSLIYWINNFRFAEVPQWDLSLYISLFLTPTLAILWQGFVPEFFDSIWGIQRHLCYGMGIAAVVWGSFRIYLLSFLVAIVIMSLAMCQLISSIVPKDALEQSTHANTGNDNDGEEKQGKEENESISDDEETVSGNTDAVPKSDENVEKEEKDSDSSD